MDTKNPRAGSDAEASVSIAADAISLTRTPHTLQPAHACQLQALRLIDRHRVRPALAYALASLCFGEPR